MVVTGRLDQYQRTNVTIVPVSYVTYVTCLRLYLWLSVTFSSINRPTGTDCVNIIEEFMSQRQYNLSMLWRYVTALNECTGAFYNCHLHRRELNLVHLTLTQLCQMSAMSIPPSREIVAMFEIVLAVTAWLLETAFRLSKKHWPSSFAEN